MSPSGATGPETRTTTQSSLNTCTWTGCAFISDWRRLMRILVVEDDKKIASFVIKGLKQSGFAADHAANGKVVSKALILEHVWDYSFDPQTNVVDVVVCRLRNKIDRDFDRKMIQTLRGVGYVLKAD